MQTNNNVQIFWVITLLIMLLLLILVNLNQNFYNQLYLRIFNDNIQNENQVLINDVNDQTKSEINDQNDLANVIDNILLETEKVKIKDYNLVYVNDNNLFSFNTENNIFEQLNYQALINTFIRKIEKTNDNNLLTLECNENNNCKLIDSKLDFSESEILTEDIIDFAKVGNLLVTVSSEIIENNEEPSRTEVNTFQNQQELKEYAIKIKYNSQEIEVGTYQEEDFNSLSINNKLTLIDNRYIIFYNNIEENILIYNIENGSSRTLENYQLIANLDESLVILDQQNQFYNYNIPNDLLLQNNQMNNIGIDFENNQLTYNNERIVMHNPELNNSYVYTASRDITNIIESFYPIQIIDDNLIGIKHECEFDCLEGNKILSSNAIVQIINLRNFDTKEITLPISNLENFELIGYEL